jgi:glyoxylase-like metal-dependent hydrolase (beta-lactamase superfamily II)
MRLTRRTFLATATAALPFRAFAGSTLTLGDMRIDTLSDGNLVLPIDFILGGMPQAETLEILARHGAPSDRLEPPCNLTLLRHEDRVVLFDAGSGPDFMPSAGRLLEALDAAGVAPDQVTHVVFTHGHPDHLWGVLDDFDEPLFPAAQHLMGAAEHAYWLDPATVDTIGEARASFAAGAKRRLEALEMTTFADGDEVVPGVFALATPGHTPGHMAFELRAGADRVMLAGDAIGNHHVAFERPGWASGSDQAPELASETRVALLARIAEQGGALIGFHLPQGGIGRVETEGVAYRFAPS